MVKRMARIIWTEELTKWYGNTEALAGLELSCEGKVNGLIGRNGAGKTTTLLILLGLVKPTEGKCFVQDLDCTKFSFNIRQKVGVLHEKPQFPKHITGIRLLQFILRLNQKKGNHQQYISRILNEVGLKEAARRSIGTYSAGMVQRLGLAQALISEPEIVFLDEPTANLDPLGRREVLNLIKQLGDDKEIRFLISTHILTELEQICDWVSIIEEGQIITQGKITDLISRVAGSIFQIATNDPVQLAEKLRGDKCSGLISIQIIDEKVICETKDPETFQHTLVQIAAKHGIAIRGLKKLDQTLEELLIQSLRGVEHEYGN